MPFPHSDREVFKRNLITEAICQLQFPPILRIKAQPPAEFQEQIRSEYPLYVEESSEFPLPPDLEKAAGGLSIRLGPVDVVHRFATADEKRTLTLSPSFIALSEKGYENRDVFRETILRAEKEFRGQYQSPFYTRIGVRYKNVIDAIDLTGKPIPWDELLNPQLLGALGATEIKDDIKESVTKIEVQVPDIEEARIRISHGFAHQTDGSVVYTTDADFFTIHRWSGEHVGKIIDTFTDLNGRFFRWFITERLKTILRTGCIIPTPPLPMGRWRTTSLGSHFRDYHI